MHPTGGYPDNQSAKCMAVPGVRSYGPGKKANMLERLA